MGRSNKIKFNSRGFKQILLGSGTSSAVNAAAYRMRSRAGKGIVVRSMVGGYGGGRAVAFVTTQAKTPEDAEHQRESLESAAHGV